jgi:4'-phosphopantetheinyl transferase
MDKKTLHLWYSYPGDLLSDDVVRACSALLSEEELARAGRFRFGRHRRESLATRALVRTALSHYRPLSPADWRFTANAHGKPGVDPDCGLRFNLSNTVELVVCLIAEGSDVGVDAESHARAMEILDLAPKVFSTREQAQLNDLPEAEKQDRALSLWTLKEAYVKARGLGLSLPLCSFSFVFGGPEVIHLEVNPELGDDPERWRFCLLNHAGHRIAVIAERAAANNLEVWEARSVLAPPVRVFVECDGWFPR